MQASRRSPFDTLQNLARRARQNRETLKVKAPTWRMKEVDNPELRGAKNFDEFIEKLIEAGRIRRSDLNPQAIAVLKRGYKNIGRKGTATIHGDILPKYIKGSKHYQKASLGEILDFIKANPKRFAKGVAGAAGGAAMAGLGTKLFTDAIREKKREKKANEYLEYIYKMAATKKEDIPGTPEWIEKMLGSKK